MTIYFDTCEPQTAKNLFYFAYEVQDISNLWFSSWITSLYVYKNQMNIKKKESSWF